MELEIVHKEQSASCNSERVWGAYWFLWNEGCFQINSFGLLRRWKSGLPFIFHMFGCQSENESFTKNWFWGNLTFLFSQTPPSPSLSNHCNCQAVNILLSGYSVAWTVGPTTSTHPPRYILRNKLPNAWHSESWYCGTTALHIFPLVSITR